MTARHTTRDEADAAWNTRASDATIADLTTENAQLRADLEHLRMQEARAALGDADLTAKLDAAERETTQLRTLAWEADSIIREIRRDNSPISLRSTEWRKVWWAMTEGANNAVAATKEQP
jgi:hypothetical protein